MVFFHNKLRKIIRGITKTVSLKWQIFLPWCGGHVLCKCSIAVSPTDQISSALCSVDIQ